MNFCCYFISCDSSFIRMFEAKKHAAPTEILWKATTMAMKILDS